MRFRRVGVVGRRGGRRFRSAEVQILLCGALARMRAAAASHRADLPLALDLHRGPSGRDANVAGSGFLKVAIMRRHSSSSRPSCCL